MCTNSTILIIFKIVGILINLTKIFLPLAIIVKTIMDIGKESISGTDYKSVFNRFKNRLIAAILVFFVPIIISTVFNMVDDGYTGDNLKCLMNVTDDTIQNAYVSEANEVVSELEKKYSYSKYEEAKSLINSIKDDNKKVVLLNKVNTVYENNKPSKIHITNTGSSNSSSTNTGTNYSYVTSTSSATSTSSSFNTYGFPYYKQCDSRYANINGYNTCNCGCGFTSLAMVIDALNGTSLTPIGVINTFNPSNYASSYCAIYDSTLTMSELKSKFGISSSRLFGPGYTSEPNEVASRKQKLVDALNNGYIIILNVPGHYIVLGSISGDKIRVYDPANVVKTREYTIDDLYNSYKNHKNRCEKNGKCGFYQAIAYKK